MHGQERLLGILVLLSLTSSSANAAAVAFKPAANYPVGTNPKAVAAADFDRDGHVDLAIANQGAAGEAGNISILIGNGDGTFKSATNLTGEKNPSVMAAADFNRDDNVDLVLIDGASAFCWATATARSVR